MTVSGAMRRFLLVLLAVALLAPQAFAQSGTGTPNRLCKQGSNTDCNHGYVSGKLTVAPSWTNWSKWQWSRNLDACSSGAGAHGTVEGVPCDTVTGIANLCEKRDEGAMGEKFFQYCQQKGLGERFCETDDYEKAVFAATNGAGFITRFLPAGGSTSHRRRLDFAAFLQRSKQIGKPARFLGTAAYPDEYQQIHAYFQKQDGPACTEQRTRADLLIAMLGDSLQQDDQLIDAARFIAEVYADDIMMGHITGVFKHLKTTTIEVLKQSKRGQRVNILLSEYEASPADYLVDALPNLKPCLEKSASSAQECLSTLRDLYGKGKDYRNYVSNRDAEVAKLLNSRPEWQKGTSKYLIEAAALLDLCGVHSSMYGGIAEIRQQCRD
jgi:hypothetical protein